jgi:hypothetical protein
MEVKNPGRRANEESLNNPTFTTYSDSLSDNQTRKTDRKIYPVVAEFHVK